jgi:hypothetical protein
MKMNYNFVYNFLHCIMEYKFWLSETIMNKVFWWTIDRCVFKINVELWMSVYL